MKRVSPIIQCSMLGLIEAGTHHDVSLLIVDGLHCGCQWFGSPSWSMKRWRKVSLHPLRLDLNILTTTNDLN